MNKNNDLITIIIPVFNTEKFLEKCIESVLGQTYKNIEIILINDASIDKSGEICEEYAKKYNNIKYINNKKNQGVSKTRNIGIENSTGRYICFIDSDDYISENYLENLYNNNEESSLAMCEILRFCNGKIFTKKILKNNINRYNKIEFLQLYKIGLINSPCARLYDNNIINLSRIRFDEDLSLGEDLLFNFQYLKKVKNIKLIPNIYYYYRQENENSLSTKYVEDMLNIQKRLCTEFCEFFKENIEEEKSEDIINFCTTIVSNEFHNKNKNIFLQYMSARKILKDNWVKSTIEKQKKYMNKIEYFCIKNNLYLMYKFIIKIIERK